MREMITVKDLQAIGVSNVPDKLDSIKINAVKVTRQPDEPFVEFVR